MKKIRYFLVLFVLVFFVYPVFSQETNNSLTLDKEDEKFKEDLYLTDTDFFKKYVQQFKSSDSKFLYDSYIEANDPEIKIYVLRTAATKGIDDETIVKLFTLGLSEGFWNFKHYDKMAIYQAWKVRAAAAYLIEQNAEKIQNTKNKVVYARKLLIAMDTDWEERVRGVAAIALGKLYAKEDVGNKNKTLVVTSLVSYLDKTYTRPFFHWSIIKSLGYLKDQRGFYPLLQARKNRVNRKTTLEISRSLSSIINAGGGGSK